MESAERMMTLGRIDRFLLAGSLIALGMVAGSAAYAVGYTQSLRAALNSAGATAWASLLHALTMALASAVGAFGLLAVALFGLFWFVRVRVREPLAQLSSVMEAELRGASEPDLPVLVKEDEIARLTRAAHLMSERYKERDAQTVAQTVRLRKEFDELEAATLNAKRRIDQACLEAAKASRGALEAAAMAQTYIRQIDTRNLSSQTIKAPSRTTGRDNAADLGFAHKGHKRSETLETLMHDLAVVEKKAPARQPFRSEEASVLNASVIDAIDRLNILADRVAEAAGRRPARSAQK
jgi:hypothetical protein